MAGILKKTSHMAANARAIEQEICSYMSYESIYSSKDFIASLSDSFIKDVCPEAQNLPAALIVWEEKDIANVTLHLREDIFNTLDRNSINSSLLSTQDGLTAFLILIEEISHFHYYIRHAESETPVTRFEMELQAEIEKPITAALLMTKRFGRSHIKHLTKFIFDHSLFHGSVTDYKLASKIAEKFWKNHLQNLGEGIIYDSRFRRLVQMISRRTGYEKQRSIWEETLKSAG